MSPKSEPLMIALLLSSLFAFSTFTVCLSAAIPPKQSKSGNHFAFSAVFPVHGNVYPLGYYSVSLSIGKPPKLYDLDIDTGSELTWVQCDAPCTGCTKPRHSLYNPKGNLVPCKDPVCSAIHLPSNPNCEAPDDQCDYEVEYADQGSSLGVLVRDHFPLRLSNGTILGLRLVFGCGYDQRNPNSISLPPTAGVLGLGDGKASIMAQLHGQGLARNVFGHCLSGQGGGFLFLGDDHVKSSGISWVQMSHKSSEKYYSAGPAELLYARKPIGVKGLKVVFDSGSSYTYFTSHAYKTTLDLVRRDLNGKVLKETTDDETLPICWKGIKQFKNIHDINHYFKTLFLSFTRQVQLQIPPEAYLIISKHGNVCLGILNGNEIGLGDFTIIGDISLQDKMVIYDNEQHRIGWVSANCNRLPNEDSFEGFCQPYGAEFGALREFLGATCSKELDSARRLWGR